MSTPQLDWTFGPAPAGDEAPLGPGPRRPRPSPAAALRLSRRTWLLLGALAALALALTVALPALQLARSRQAVEQVVARQEQARLAGDWDGLSATYAKDSQAWGVTHVLRQRNGWLPTPISLPGLRSDGQPGRVSRFQVVGPQTARAEVTRGFILADGTRAAFAMPQYYQFGPGTWQQAPPPDVPSDQAQHFHGARVDATYYPDDADWAPNLAHDLDDLMQRACADWGCPPEVRAEVVFDPSDPAAAASRPPFDSLLGSLTLQSILGRPSTYPALSVNLATRVTGGYPADAATAEAVRRAAGVRALILVAQQLAPNILLHGENMYFDALIAREAARLGIDEAGLAQLQIANPMLSPSYLWSVPLLHVSSAGALPEALVILNHILANRDLTDEQRLMHAFNDAHDAQSWLSAGLNIAPDDASAQLAAGLEAPFPTVQPLRFTPDFALSCRAGPLLGTLGGQVAPLLDGNLPASTVEAWSPDGQRLALRVSGRLSLVDLASRTGQFLPMTSIQEGIPLAWVSNTLLVYPAGLGTTASSGNSRLFYFEIGPDGPHDSKALPNYMTYLASPNGAWAAVQGDVYGSQPSLAVIPALSGQPIFNISGGYNPAWSADSQHLAFAVRDGDKAGLAIYDVAGRAQRTVVWFDDPVAVGARGPASLTAAWSPSGDRLALALLGDTGSGYAGYAVTVAPDGSNGKMLIGPPSNLPPDALAYSADGRYLAVDLFDGPTPGAADVALYSPDGLLLRWLPGYQLGAWSPAGHRLALVGLDGVSLLSEPQAEPQIIGPEGCSGLAWNPSTQK